MRKLFALLFILGVSQIDYADGSWGMAVQSPSGLYGLRNQNPNEILKTDESQSNSGIKSVLNKAKDSLKRLCSCCNGNENDVEDKKEEENKKLEKSQPKPKPVPRLYRGNYDYNNYDNYVPEYPFTRWYGWART